MVGGCGQDLPDADIAPIDQMGVGQQVGGCEVAVAAGTVSRSEVSASVVATCVIR
jgi:hypothetical protein